MSAFRGLDISASGMTAHQIWREAVTINLANTETTKTLSSEPFHHKLVIMMQDGLGVRITATVDDPFPFRLVYAPSHPDADLNGYVRMPNVHPVLGMVDLPEQTMFKERREEPSASVVLALKPARVLSPEQNRAIAFLVSRTIEGLEPKKVVIVDTKGLLLWTGDLSSDGFSHASEYLGMRGEIEQAIERRLQNLLDRTIGSGRASVRVSVELDTNKRESESEIYMPADKSNQGVPATHEETRETYQAQGAPAAGFTGATSNLQLVPPMLVTLLGGNYNKTERKPEYQVSRRIERTEQLPGSVRQVSATILVKGELTAAEQASLKQAVIAAVGLDLSRGDTVAVVPVRAERATVPQLERRRAQKAPKFSWYWLAAVPVLLLVAAPLLVAWRRKHRMAPAAPSFPSEAPKVPKEEEKAPAPLPVPETVHSIERLGEVAKTSPERLVDLIRGWLLEDKLREEGRR